MSAWGDVAAFTERVPPGVWAFLLAANLVATLVTWSTARRRIRRAGKRAADPQLVAGGVARSRDRALTVAALIPAGLFWAMVLAGSFHGLIAFGRGVLGWRGGWEFLVPGTLDGVSVTFAFLAFRAVRLRKAPDRCYRVMWGATAASATVNFAYEYTHSDYNVVAGGYVALLSLFGLVMLHEFLAQFEEGAAYVRRGNPRFGARWMTWPTNTSAPRWPGITTRRRGDAGDGSERDHQPRPAPGAQAGCLGREGRRPARGGAGGGAAGRRAAGGQGRA